LAAYFSQTKFTAIYTSDLRRATVTAEFLRAAQQAPTPPLIKSSLLREQYFGIAEGKDWIYREPGFSLEEELARGRYADLCTRSEKFPEGESREDVARRSDEAITTFLLPYLWQAAREGNHGTHVAIISHGYCIEELVAALVSKGAHGQVQGSLTRWLGNTGWCSVDVAVEVQSGFQ
jgi:broad specificity phosphatase PhoE